MNHNVNNSQCDLNLYGPDPGDGSVVCSCAEDQPIEPAVGTARPVLVKPVTAAEMRAFAASQTSLRESGPEHPHFGTGPHVVTLQGRAATTHAELREAGRELRAAQDLFTKAQARYKAALDAHMQELV